MPEQWGSFLAFDTSIAVRNIFVTEKISIVIKYKINIISF
jgi:hypothetical protein